MIELSGVSKIYQGEVKVLDHVSLNLKAGDFLYLVGGSGAGKSTFLKMLSSEESPSFGKVILFGHDLANANFSTIRAIRQSIGYIPQNLQLVLDLSVVENVALSLSLAGKRVLGIPAKHRIYELLDRLGLMQKKDFLIKNLSGGEAQRVAVARALVRNPALILADEPTGAQDHGFTWTIMDLFSKINREGTAVVVATHDREIVRKMRKRCALLKGGKVALEEGMCIF